MNGKYYTSEEAAQIQRDFEDAFGFERGGRMPSLREMREDQLFLEHIQSRPIDRENSGTPVSRTIRKVGEAIDTVVGLKALKELWNSI